MFSFRLVMTYLALFCIGFANALPLPLFGSTLSIWLAEEGLSKGSIGLFALLAIPFSLKIMWSSVVDIVSLPFFRKSQRKGWVLVSLWGIGGVLSVMSYVSPVDSLLICAACVCMLSICTGCLYIAGIAYELDSLEASSSSVGSACVLTGYRIGLLCAGAGALYVAFFAGWESSFRCMAGLIFLASLVVLFGREPFRSQETVSVRKALFSKYRNWQVGVWQECFVQPSRTFFQQAEWKLLLLVVLAFKLGDQLAHSMIGPFYVSLGFTKTDIASSSKLWGMCATIFGAFAAGIIFKKRDPLRPLCLLACLHSISLLCLSWLAFVGNSNFWLCASVACENCTGGMAMALFISFLWQISDRKHASAQYALLWSVFSLKGEIAAWLGSVMASFLTWSAFFGFVACLGSALSMVAYWFICKSKKSIIPLQA